MNFTDDERELLIRGLDPEIARLKSALMGLAGRHPVGESREVTDAHMARVKATAARLRLVEDLRKRIATRYWIYFGAGDPVDLDTPEGEARRRERVFYDTPEEARAAIRELPNRLERCARVEESELLP